MAVFSKRIFVTDCEGPITKNDNAAEMSAAFLPSGDEFFAKVSLYDDYLAEIAHKSNYKAGDTLKLILPFFKAFGVDDRSMTKFSRKTVEVIPLAQEALNQLTSIAPCYVVSTSYTPYIKAVCDALAFPLENTFSTEINIDNFRISFEEKTIVKDLYSKILEAPGFCLKPNAESMSDLDPESQKSIMALDVIFWEELVGLEIGKLLGEVNPIGGKEKAAAIKKIIGKSDVSLEDVIYVGDSITDIEAFRLVKSGGGLAVSFNGNDWAVKEASIAITSNNALPTAFIASMFLEHGPAILDDLLVTHMRKEIIAEVTRQSVKVRKSVRSEKIGALG